ncbi:MAG: hypothetical protein FWG83_03810 [Oscillospiraceae bacterium]|nr:hypothetical protein [Oscillospiraceae bacterium]
MKSNFKSFERKIIAPIVILAMILALVGCDAFNDLFRDAGGRDSASDSSEVTIEPVVETVYENHYQLDRFIAEMSEDFAVSGKAVLKDVTVWDDLNDYYDSHSELLSLYGIKGIAAEILTDDEKSQAEITLQYEMYMNILAADKNGDSSRLSEKEVETYEKAKSILAEITEGFENPENTSVFEKSYAIHAILVDLIEYDDDYADNSNAFNVYGALAEGKAVCQGYVHAYKMLLSMAGIESVIITGTAGTAGEAENHAWNLVNYGDESDPKWYHVDVTWNDQEGIRSHRYFNVSDSHLHGTHLWRAALYPDVVSSNEMEYNYFSYTGWTADSPSALKSLFGERYSKSQTGYEILCEFNVEETDLTFLDAYASLDEIGYLISDYGVYKLLMLVLQ